MSRPALRPGPGHCRAVSLDSVSTRRWLPLSGDSACSVIDEAPQEPLAKSSCGSAAPGHAPGSPATLLGSGHHHGGSLAHVSPPPRRGQAVPQRAREEGLWTSREALSHGATELAFIAGLGCGGSFLPILLAGGCYT